MVFILPFLFILTFVVVFGRGKEEEDTFLFFEKVNNPVITVQHVLDDSVYIHVHLLECDVQLLVFQGKKIRI